MKTEKLSLKNDTFQAFKNDFDEMLNMTLRAMQKKNVPVSELKMNMKISLRTGVVRDFDQPGEDAKKEIVQPEFEHKVTATMKVEQKIEGEMAGDYELVFDDREGYKLKAIEDGQTTMFEGDRV